VPRAHRLAGALPLVAVLAAGWDVRPAYAANCVNVLLRDATWGQYRGVVLSTGTAAGMGTAFARNGFAVDGVPDAGAIMVWPGGAYGASGAGHVGIVAAVYGNGTVLVRHENWPIGSGEHLQVFAVFPGHRFVHPFRVVRAAAPAPAPVWAADLEAQPEGQPEGQPDADTPADAGAPAET
jgi:surface antigen